MQHQNARKMIIKLIVTIVFVATIVAGRQQQFSDDEDVIVKTRRGLIFPVQLNINLLLQQCNVYNFWGNKPLYVGGSKFQDGAKRCKQHETDKVPKSGTCFWAPVTKSVKECEKGVKEDSTPLRQCETYLLQKCIGQRNIQTTSNLPHKEITGSVYIIV